MATFDLFAMKANFFDSGNGGNVMEAGHFQISDVLLGIAASKTGKAKALTLP